MSCEIIKLQNKIKELEYCSLSRDNFEILKNDFSNIEKKIDDLIAKNQIGQETEEKIHDDIKNNQQCILVILAFALFSIGTLSLLVEKMI